jgi:uncharacterized membrane protein
MSQRSSTMEDLTSVGLTVFTRGGAAAGPEGVTTMHDALRLLTVLGCVGGGLVGGVFYAFSGFVLAALRRLPAAQGVAAMRAINATAVRAPLMLALFGTAALVTAAAVVAVVDWRASVSPYAVLAAASYLVGTVGLTATSHVPRNERLDRLAPDDAVAWWPRYLASWTTGNHLRTLTSLATAALSGTAAVLA